MGRGPNRLGYSVLEAMAGQRKQGFRDAQSLNRARRVCHYVARQGLLKARISVDHRLHADAQAAGNCMERAAMKKLRFVRSWRAYRAGQAVEVPGGLAAELIARGVAVEDRQTLIETAAMELAGEMADATPKRRRKRP